jgi:hypothetical protein
MDDFDRKLHDALSGLCCHMAAMDAYHWEVQAVNHAMTVLSGRVLPNDEREKAIEDLGKLLVRGDRELTREEEAAIRRARFLIRRNRRFCARDGENGERMVTRIPLLPLVKKAA